MNELKYEVIKLLLDNAPDLEGVEVKEDTMLISSGYIDSFDIINLITAFEEAFRVDIPLDEIELMDFDSVSTICKLIQNRKS